MRTDLLQIINNKALALNYHYYIKYNFHVVFQCTHLLVMSVPPPGSDHQSPLSLTPVKVKYTPPKTIHYPLIPTEYISNDGYSTYCSSNLFNGVEISPDMMALPTIEKI